MEVAAVNSTTYSWQTAPEWLNSGDNAWQMVAATLVAMMSIPGLAAIYAGLLKNEWDKHSALMVFYAFAATLVCWVLYAYKFAFGERMVFFWGRPGAALTHKFLLHRAAVPASLELYANGTVKTPMEAPMFPMASLVYFQFAFAAVAVVLVAGSVIGRMYLQAWMLFAPLWVTFSYTMGAFSVWGGGFLYHWGVIDFAGGFVVHLAAGTAAFTLAAWVGKTNNMTFNIPHTGVLRRLPNQQAPQPANHIDGQEDQQLTSRVAEKKEVYSVPSMVVGAGLLWLGWIGFNGGTPYTSGLAASMAILNTYVSAATSVLVWTSLDIISSGNSSLVHAIQAMVVGLVCITPAAGVVEGWAALTIGLCGGLATWGITVELRKRRRQETQQQERWNILEWISNVDDRLNVVETHAIPGLIGGIFAGLFAEPSLCDLNLPIKGLKGAFYGHPSQLGKQLCVASFVILLNIVVTSIICIIIITIAHPICQWTSSRVPPRVEPNGVPNNPTNDLQDVGYMYHEGQV